MVEVFTVENCCSVCAKTNAGKRVVLIDPHPMVRQGIAALLEKTRGVHVCEQATTVAEAADRPGNAAPDLIVLHIDASAAEGSTAGLVDLKAAFPGTAVLILTMSTDWRLIHAVLGTGAKGFLSGEDGCKRLSHAVTEVLAGRVYVSPMAASAFFEGMVDSASRLPEELDDLTLRELDVFRLLGQGHGLGTAEIADKLGISPKTVDTHRRNIQKKLGIPNSRGLYQSAVRLLGSPMAVPDSQP